MLSLSDIKTGTNLILDDMPHTVLSHEHSKMGRAGAVLRTKLRNLQTGAVIDKTFQGADKVAAADMTKSPAQYLYAEGDVFHFMDMESFEQFSLKKENITPAQNYLTEELSVTTLSFNGTPLAITLPVKVTLSVTDAPPNVKGDTQSGGDKMVTLETGMHITTPLFVEAGDKIVVNTEKGVYVSKVS